MTQSIQNPLTREKHVVAQLEAFVVAVIDDERASDGTTQLARITTRDSLVYSMLFPSIPEQAAPPDVAETVDLIMLGVSAGVAPITLCLGNMHCVWYSHDGAGADPDHPDRESIGVTLPAGALTATQVAAATATTVNAHDYYNASSNGSTVSVEGADYFQAMVV